MKVPWRHAELVLAIDEADVDGLSSEVLVLLREEPPDMGLRVFSVKSGEPGPRSAEDHLEDLWRAFEPILSAIDGAEIAPRTCVLRVVEYVGPDDEIGAGVPVDAAWIATLAHLNGFVDIDIYVEG